VIKGRVRARPAALIEMPPELASCAGRAEAGLFARYVLPRLEHGPLRF
jgi:hypothetical protein